MYKVVNQYLMSSNKHGKYAVQYKINEFVYPVLEGSKLFVIDTLDNAFRYLNDCGNLDEDGLQIYECECTNVEPGKDLEILFVTKLNALIMNRTDRYEKNLHFILVN